MWTLIAATLLTSALPDVELRSARGESAVGKLVELDSRHVTVQAAAGPVTWELGNLASLSVRDAAGRNVRPPITVELIDGSKIGAEAFTTETGKAHVKLASGKMVDIAGEDVRSVRFVQSGETMAGQWAKIAAGPTTSDLLIVKKGEGIDYHKGILRRITEDTVEFELENERLPVRRSKVYGLVYHHSSGRELPEPFGMFVDRHGCAWVLRTMTLVGEQLEWTTVLGLKLRQPAAELARLDFSRGRVAYLSDLQPDSVEWVPYFGDKPLPSLIAMNRPRQDVNLDSGPLRLDGKDYPKGLAMHAGTIMVYRLPDRYRRFVAVAGIDDAVRPLGKVRLVIHGDDRILFNEMVTGPDVSKAIDLDMSGIRRLTIRTEFSDDFDVGDHLDLCDARLLK
jgi:hypothetical protein